MDAKRTQARKSGGRRSARERRAGRRWRFEELENRRLLAAQYDFAVNLYEDAGGVPGKLITDDAVQTGETFFVEITAEDLRPGGLGFGSMGLHIGWDPQILREIDEPFDPRDPASPLMTAAFPLARAGEFDQEAGRIMYLTGGALLSMDAGRAIGADGPERLSLLHFRALQTAEYTPLYVQPSGDIGFIPMRPFSLDELVFESQLITVNNNPTAPSLPADAASPSRVAVADGDAGQLQTTLPVPSAVWRNAENPRDVDTLHGVTPLDALIAVNYINAHPGDPTLPGVQVAPPPFYDVNGDSLCTSHDVLLVINSLATPETQGAEGEADVSGVPALAAATENRAAPPASSELTGSTPVTAETLAIGRDANFIAPVWSADPAANALAESGGAQAHPVFSPLPSDERTVPRRVHPRASSADPTAQPAGQAERDARRSRSAAGIHAVFRSPGEWTASALDIEDVLDALAGAWAGGQDGPRCVREGG